MNEITLEQLKEIIERGLAEDEIIIDVRNPQEFRGERIRGTRNIPVDEILAHVDEVKGYKKVYIHCSSGSRCKIACEKLEGVGVDSNILYHVAGKEISWADKGLPLEKGKKGVPYPLQAQVYMFLSVFALIGLFLSVTVSLWYLLMPAFVTFNFFVSAVKQEVGGKKIFAKFPWNK